MQNTYVYIICGGGSAGCVLANRLSEDEGCQVLLLEAGGSDRHPLFHMPAGFAKMTKGIASWGWHTAPQKNLKGRVLRYTQAKVIGGGSTINAQVYARGNPLDFDSWSEGGNFNGWDYKSVLPYFKRAEDNQHLVDDYHGYGGPLGVSRPSATLPICDAFLRAAQEMGLPFNPDFNGRVQAGVGFYQVTRRDERRSSAATAHLKPVRDRKNLTVLQNVNVRSVLLKGNRAIGVSAAVDGQLKDVLTSREVIVSAGAIGSPKLLLQSDIGPKAHLESVGIKVQHHLACVGANLQDHVDLCVICECTGDHTYDGVAKLHRTIAAGVQYMLTKTGPAASSLFETGGFWYVDPNARSPDMQFHLGLGSGIEAGIEKLKNPGVTLNSAYMRPRSRGTVKLASANPDDAPLIDPNYWSDPNDRAMSLAGLRMAREIMSQKALKSFVLAERVPGPAVASDEALIDYACANAKTDHHPVGACKMGVDEMSVVSPDLRVHGIEGLRVCDASVMPYVTSGNTNAPAIMVGEKGADLIRGIPALRSARIDVPSQRMPHGH